MVPVFLRSLRRVGSPAVDSSAGRVLASDMSVSPGGRGSVDDDLVGRIRGGGGCSGSEVGGSSAAVLGGSITG